MKTIPTILMQDDHIVVFDKPSGLLSVPGIGPEKPIVSSRELRRCFQMPESCIDSTVTPLE